MNQNEVSQNEVNQNEVNQDEVNQNEVNRNEVDPKIRTVSEGFVELLVNIMVQLARPELWMELFNLHTNGIIDEQCSRFSRNIA